MFDVISCIFFFFFCLQYTWKREDGSRLPPNAQVRNNELYIYNVRKQDEGRYICEASANGVRLPSSFAELYVKREYQDKSARISRNRYNRYNRRY